MAKEPKSSRAAQAPEGNQLGDEANRRSPEGRPSILELLAQPGAEDTEFDPPRLGGGLFRHVDLS